jgi:predicted ATPase
MRITNLELKNFKRFTDLTIDGIPEKAKLVLLIGSNGSGKSSVFDAFDFIVKQFSGNTYSPVSLEHYYSKNNLREEISITFSDGDSIKMIDKSVVSSDTAKGKLSKFAGRSSVRIVPRITNQINLDFAKSNTDGPLTFIDADQRFDSDVSLYMQEIDDALRAPVFRGESADTLKIFHEYIEPLNTSLINILGGDTTTTIQIVAFNNPTAQTNGQLIFQKGESRINYDLLSHGEKQIVILLLNFIVRKHFYNDAIIFIDEMDCHLNTVLQTRLLNEIINTWIPEKSQLWTASHALGFIDFAKHSENAALIDLDLLNFDIPQVIRPEPHENMEVYDIAVPKEIIKKIFTSHKLVAVENKNDEQYNLALGEKGFIFLPASNSHDVFLTTKREPGIMGLRDRDYLKFEEIEAIKKKFPRLKILTYYAFENYIYHPDNLEELGWEGFNKEEYLQEITRQKNNHLLSIVGKIATARQKYPELKELTKKETENIDPIIEALNSSDFEAFYPFFSMKTYFDKSYLTRFCQYIPSDLVKTNWFKESILKVLNA